MVAEIKLAVAGSGKTRWLGDNVLLEKRNLLITFTNQNVKNIKHSIQRHHGEIPENTYVMTYTRFVYYWLLRPFEPSIKVGDHVGSFRSSGIDITTPPVHDRENPGNGYYTKDKVFHYLSRWSNGLFSNRLSDLYCCQPAVYKKKARERLDKFFDAIYVDEFQDFTDADYKLLVDLAKISDTEVHYVGDFYQSLVSNSNKRRGTPYSKITELSEMIDEFREKKFEVDTQTLRRSWRCSAEVCTFVNSRLGIPIESADEHDGSIVLLSNQLEIMRTLNNTEITKLMWSSAVPGYDLFPSTNKWGYSKGDTYRDICVVLTDSTDHLLEDTELKLKPQTLHRLYVALTRAKRNVFLVKRSDYLKALKNQAVS